MKDGDIVASGAKDDVLASLGLEYAYGVKIELQRASDGVQMVGARL